MEEVYHIIEGKYIDSVLLMQISREIEKLKGVNKAGCMVATPENLSFFTLAGFHPPSGVSSDSILIAVDAEDKEIGQMAINKALELIDEGMIKREEKYRLEDLADLVKSEDFPVLFVSTPGEYVYDICNKALDYNVNIHIFSSNVPLEQEVELKKKGEEKGLLVMGPDCGTSIIQGKGLGFSNELTTVGDIGVIGSSGTGIQELTVLLDKSGLGISHAIGVGSNDLKREVGGIMTKESLAFLKDKCSAFALICKKPDPSVEEEIIGMLQDKPSVFIALGRGESYTKEKVFVTGVIDEAVSYLSRSLGKVAREDVEVFPSIKVEEKERKLLKGYFVGGSLCYQAQAILHSDGVKVHSNSPVSDDFLIGEDYSSLDVCIDTGAEEFVAGRPHPMIDPVSRNSLIVKESERKDVKVLLFDVILGYGSADDPIEGLEEIQPGPIAVASICGTIRDKQDYSKIRKRLESKGVIVFDSASKAARFASKIMRED